MAGGQAITSGQGSVTQSESLALSGIASTVSAGTIVASSPADVAMTGEQFGTAIGSTAPARLVAMRSRKVGGGSASRTLVGIALVSSHGDVAKTQSRQAVGIALSGATGSVTRSRTVALNGQATTSSAGTMAPSGLAWSGNLPSPLTVNRGGFFDLAPYISDPGGELGQISPSTSLPSGVAIASTPTWRITATSGATLGNTAGLILTLVRTAEADFLSRISGTQAVWYHGFDSAAEVNQFRWTGGYSGGNDPLALGEGGTLLTHVATGGPSGGGFLRSTYPAGSVAGRGNSYWWRPFAAFTGATNGRGSNDPGAGTISPVAWNVSNGSSTLLSWANATNPAWYGNAADVALNPTKYQGTDFWLQVRVRRAQTPGAPPDAPPYTSITGKNVWLTTTNSSYTAQELVTYGQSVSNGDTVGVFSRHNVYSGQNFTSLGGGQPNATVTISNLTLNWRFSGGWDTLLYHISPGTSGGTGSNRTRVEIWAQHDPALAPSEAGVYTKIWDVTYSQGFDSGTGGLGGPNLPGWNALILGSYHNGSAFATSFNFDYGQIIFSKSTIAAPNV